MTNTDVSNSSIPKLACIWLTTGLLILSGCETIVNSVQGAPEREIYPGQTVTSDLKVSVHQTVEVTTTKQLAGFTSSHSYNNPHIKNVRGGSPIFSDVSSSKVVGHSSSRSTERWKINTEFLTEPTEVVLIVAGDGFMPIVVLDDFLLPQYSATQNTVAGVYTLKPKVSYSISVQGTVDDQSSGTIYQLVLKQYK